ncbi:MAG TPA: nucleoside triphosphate pyrophosphohydrolase family protein [bacterium]|nr:nucleoside triphosphate pyrophosphohydrolase family protein [bacterium]HPT29722.1 nucleoside triphosphate pyrophosphohydrolase family protein [bacterium]
MTFAEYQAESQKTAIYPDRGNNLAYTVLGLNGEAGEVADKLKKIIRDQNYEINETNRQAIAEELGDVLWYIAQAATELKIDFEAIAQNNLTKLFSRQDRNKLNGSGDNR